jgi:hypothetical protein
MIFDLSTRSAYDAVSSKSTKVPSECLSSQFTTDGLRMSARARQRRVIGFVEVNSWVIRAQENGPRTRDVILMHEAKILNVSTAEDAEEDSKNHSRRCRGPLPKRSPSTAATGNLDGPRICFWEDSDRFLSRVFANSRSSR